MGETSFRHGEDTLEEFIFFDAKQDLKRIQDMVEKYKVITLCGNTRFKDDFMRMQKALTLQGNIVISVGCFGNHCYPPVFYTLNFCNYSVFSHTSSNPQINELLYLFINRLLPINYLSPCHRHRDLHHIYSRYPKNQNAV